MNVLDNLPFCLLVLTRMSAFVLLVPFFSIKGTPAMVKIGFSVMLSALLIPVIGITAVPGDLLYYGFLVVKEAMVGLLLGFVCMLVFNAVRMAGEIIDIQMGFSMATVFDPQNQSRITLTGQFFYLLQILLFLAVDGHHSLLMGIAYSYTAIPVMAASLEISLAAAVFKVFIQVFSLAVRVALPFMIVFLICDISMGILARTVPQLNIFVLSFPAKIGIGLITLATVIPPLTVLINSIFTQMENDLAMIMGLML